MLTLGLLVRIAVKKYIQGAASDRAGVGSPSSTSYGESSSHALTHGAESVGVSSEHSSDQEMEGASFDTATREKPLSVRISPRNEVQSSTSGYEMVQIHTPNDSDEGNG
jgi:hypothetical protein